MMDIINNAEESAVVFYEDSVLWIRIRGVRFSCWRNDEDSI